ncbi:hypothetical protein GW17_00043725, partial [Ensete ventricosum]
IDIKRLYSDPTSDVLEDLVGFQSDKNAMTQQDQLDQAFYYIKELKERVDRLRELKETRSRVMIGFRPSHVEVRNLEVILVRGSRTRFMFHEVISVLEEEGVEVISASFSIPLHSLSGKLVLWI